MYLSKVVIRNYKCFHAPTEIQFRAGLNLVTGQNSAGKSALLEIMKLDFQAKPHRSLVTVPQRGRAVDGKSEISLEITVSRNELIQILSDTNAVNFPLPAVNANSQARGYHNRANESVKAFFESLLAEPSLRFRVGMRRGENEGWFCWDWPSFGMYVPHHPSDPNNPRQRRYHQVRVRTTGEVESAGSQTTDSDVHEVGVHVAQHLCPLIFRFSAERLHIGQCRVGTSTTLSHTASNLPEVLQNLQTQNVHRFQRYIQMVREVLPQISQVTIRNTTGDVAEIMVWSIPAESERDDLAMPLSECGTGISQVLALLYVVLDERSKVLLIDEPQSFLHPGAARKLIEIFKQNSHHQYIVTTHSPTIIAAATPSTLTVIRIGADGASQAEVLNANETKHLTASLNELGARLSDVFGADNVIWVEGQTEEICFPLILTRLAGRSLMGTAIAGIRQTGDLEGRNAEVVFEIYQRLTQGSHLLPPAIGFVKDPECATRAQKDELIRRSRQRLSFLPRRMFENYLLNPRAVAAVVNSIADFRDTPVAEVAIQQSFDNKRNDASYYCNRVVPGQDTDWKEGIDGARVLAETFSVLSENRVAFQKTLHSLALTEWVLENDPEAMRDISDLLVAILGEG